MLKPKILGNHRGYLHLAGYHMNLPSLTSLRRDQKWRFDQTAPMLVPVQSILLKHDQNHQPRKQCQSPHHQVHTGNHPNCHYQQEDRPRVEAKPHMRANKATPLRQLSPRKPRSILKQEIRDGGVRATGTRAGERGNPVVLESRDVTVEDGSTMLLNLLHHWRENMRAGRSVGFTQLWANP